MKKTDRIKVTIPHSKEESHMSHSQYIRIMLDLKKDKNIIFLESFCKETRIKGLLSKAFYGTLSYTPNRCANCGMKKEEASIIKYGSKTNCLTLNSTSHYPTYLLLKKQRFYCKKCASTFCAETSEVNCHCVISNTVKQSIAVESKDKILEKDLARRHHVSPTTTSRVIQVIASQFQLYTQSLPKNLSFNELYFAIVLWFFPKLVERMDRLKELKIKSK